MLPFSGAFILPDEVAFDDVEFADGGGITGGDRITDIFLMRNIAPDFTGSAILKISEKEEDVFF